MTNHPAGFGVVKKKLLAHLGQFRRYSFVVFMVFVGALYAFVVFRIQNLSQAEPSTQAIDSQVKAAQVPHIDEKVIKQLESLQDNSVRVQTIFKEARTDPFE